MLKASKTFPPKQPGNLFPLNAEKEVDVSLPIALLEIGKGELGVIKAFRKSKSGKFKKRLELLESS